MKIIKSNISLRSYLMAIFVGLIVFFRLLAASYPFSFDYPAYLMMIDGLRFMSLADFFGDNLIFPYVNAGNFILVEIGFSLLVKIFSMLDLNSEVIFSLIAAFSVGLRVYTMSSLRVPVLWNIWINVFAITLLEANALRLGVASSVLLFGLLQLFWQRKISALIFIGISLTLHLQVSLFVLPFVIFYMASNWISRSKLNLIITLLATLMVSLVAFKLVSFLGNLKIQEYVERGSSGSAGISVTSILAILLICSVVFFMKQKQQLHPELKFFRIVIVASAPSLFALIFLTNVAVIGDRAWQLAFLIMSSFIFTDWAVAKSKMIVLGILMALSSVMQVNVLIRYPLSNFFSPPFPEINFNAF